MDASQQVNRFQEFFEVTHRAELLEIARTGQKYFPVNFADVSKFDPELASLVLEQPEDSFKAAELALEQFEIKDVKKFCVRFFNIPKSQYILIRNIRSEHLGELLWFEGVVRQKSDVRPQMTSARFECPSCGQIHSVIQNEQKFREPTRCNCGRKGKFRMLSKELIDVQRIVLEEAPEDMEGGEQQKRMNFFLQNDLVSPLTDKKTNPGSKIRITGIVNEIPIQLKSGGQSTRFDLMVTANHVMPIVEDYYDVIISPEEEQAIKDLAKDPKLFQKLNESVAPSIYGHDRIKEALLLQLAGGVKKVRDDGVTSRGDIHTLLIGDPGCIAGDSKVALHTGGLQPIQSLGKKHLQPLRLAVTKIRKNASDKPYDFTSNFQIYKKQPTVKLITETGKELVCTYNQPLLTKSGWKRADLLRINEKIRVMPRLPNNVKTLRDSGFIKVARASGDSNRRIKVPEKVGPELAAVLGYILGNGNIHPKGYRITCYVNDEEIDLIEKLENLWKQTFNVKCAIISKPNNSRKTIVKHKKTGTFQPSMIVHRLEIKSRQVAQNLKFLSKKRVPQVIFESSIRVISTFLQWLFEADGYTFGRGKGRTSVQLKSATPGLLKDVQLLLLFFGIQSHIVKDTLSIRRSRDIEVYAENIGFVSIKKQQKMKEIMQNVSTKSDTQKRKKMQIYEKVRFIEPQERIDVYDFEVPKSKQFIANGIVCHNSGKSQLLKRISLVAPKARFVSGKGASGAGLSAAVVKDEFLGGWSLEAGALPLANKGFVMIDEMDKMSDDDRSALHEGLEQQTISISKANIQATLRCETTVLAAANPKFGRFDQYELLAKQIDMPPALINRFDLIFPVMDLPDKEKDERMAKHILTLHQNPETDHSELSTDFLRKYISYVRQKMRPTLTDGAIEEIKKYYVDMRNSGSDEGGSKSVPISARQLEALVRLSEASAKLRLSEKVTKRDAKQGIDILHYCLSQIGIDPETGKIDMDRISTGISASQRSKIGAIKELIMVLEGKIGKTIPIDDLVSEAGEKGIDETVVDEVIEQLKRAGDIFEPRRGFISRI